MPSRGRCWAWERNVLCHQANCGTSLSGEIEELMDWKPVKAGDYFYIPAGTVHAIGAGITLVEVQQYADITYRLYDYGRPRELHLDDGVDVSVARPYRDARSGHVAASAQLVNGPHFNLHYIDSAESRPALPPAAPLWVIPLHGKVEASGVVAGVGECLLLKGASSLTLTGDSRMLLAY
jgi:mannose-6-phosphate isomerase